MATPMKHASKNRRLAKCRSTIIDMHANYLLHRTAGVTQLSRPNTRDDLGDISIK